MAFVEKDELFRVLKVRNAAWTEATRGEQMIRAILPYLTVKQEQARIAIEYREHATGKANAHKAPAYRKRLLDARASLKEAA